MALCFVMPANYGRKRLHKIDPSSRSTRASRRGALWERDGPRRAPTVCPRTRFGGTTGCTNRAATIPDK
jgi:hypothetical protein